jgi:hypothetical protein
MNTMESLFNQIRHIFSGHIHLLCIEDNLQVSSLLCEDFFKSSIFNNKAVNTINNARNAICSKVQYHCWILDLTLEKHNDGLELLKSKPKFPYCIVLSGSRSLSDATLSIRHGAYGAYDKNAIFTSNPHDFIKEICSLATLSFLLNAKRPERFDMFMLLVKNDIRSSDEWSNIYCVNERTVRDICEENSGLTAKQFLLFYHALNAAILSDCLIEGMAGYNYNYSVLVDKKNFYDECAEFVIHNFDTVYCQRYLEKSSTESLCV